MPGYSRLARELYEGTYMTADICVIIESTYPYVRGGVSNWLHALISNLPEFTFSIAHLGGTPEAGRQAQFRLPDNVVEFYELNVFDSSWTQQRRHRRNASQRAAELWDQLREFHEGMVHGRPCGDIEILHRFGPSPHGDITIRDLFFVRESWELLVSLYEQHAPSSSFEDYLWTFRATHLPIFSLQQSSLPCARVYHAVSGGFAGFAGALASLRTSAPLIVTEHGIATREREIEIAQAEWIYHDEETAHDVSRRFSHFQEWWLNMFRFMTKTTYDYAAAIISITGYNQRYQLRDGADPRKMLVIPNGVDIERYQRSRDEISEAASDHFIVGFIGRVVRIKDVKTYIRAIQIARREIPSLTSYIVGPMDEDPEYSHECQQLAEWLGLSNIIHFTGPADVREYYRKIDVLVLTSLSEAQPLVILEANCAGVPVVASEVGACRELLTGITPEDQAIGQSGLLTPPASPQETASAIIQLWRDPELRRRMAQAGLERAQRFYQEEAVYDAYRAMYGQHLAASPV